MIYCFMPSLQVGKVSCRVFVFVQDASKCEPRVLVARWAEGGSKISI